MCQALRELMKDEIAEEMRAVDLGHAKKTVSNMLRDGDPIDKIARVLELPVETIRSF